MKTEIKKIHNEYLKEHFYSVTHKSGLKILFVPKEFTSYYAILGVKYGSVDSCFMCDGEKELSKVPDGIAHYLEHKMFESPDGSDAFDLFSKLGASANAFTTNNMTAYLFSCTSNFSESLEALLTFVREPYFTEENVEKERGIISEEIEMYEDDPYSSMHYGILELLYKNNPVKINVAGTVSSVSEITADHLYRCYNAFYRLDNMVLSVCGDTDIDTVLEVCDRVLCSDKVSCVKRASFTEPSAVCASRNTIKRPVSRPLFCIGVKDAVVSDDRQRAKHTIACGLIFDMLFGVSSEFYANLYEDGTVSSMSSGYDSMMSYAFGYINGESDDCEGVYRVFRETVETAGAVGLSKDDFERIKKVAVANFIKTFDSTENIATDALYMNFDGIDMDTFATLLFEVDYQYVSEVFEHLFDEDRCAMMTVVPCA